MEQITVPKFLYDHMKEAQDIVRHLRHYRGNAWIETVKKEMEADKKYKQGAFNDETRLQTQRKESLQTKKKTHKSSKQTPEKRTS